jgi:hypothetical protein
MTFSILIFNYRKPGVSPAEFRTECEALIPLLKEITGEHFPLTHTRRYLHRTVRGFFLSFFFREQ